MKWHYLIEASLILKIHIFCAVLSIILGCAQFLLKKGTKFHKFVGWAWIVLMLFMAISALFVKNPGGDIILLPYFLLIWVVFGVPFAILAIKRGKILLHRAFMAGLFFGGLSVAALFIFTPGRLFYKMIFGP